MVEQAKPKCQPPPIKTANPTPSLVNNLFDLIWKSSSEFVYSRFHIPFHKQPQLTFCHGKVSILDFTRTDSQRCLGWVLSFEAYIRRRLLTDTNLCVGPGYVCLGAPRHLKPNEAHCNSGMGRRRFHRMVTEKEIMVLTMDCTECWCSSLVCLHGKLQSKMPPGTA